jgi:hypothetical protein
MDPGGTQRGQRVLAGEECAGHVHREGSFLLGERGVLDRLLELDAGGVNQDVESGRLTCDGS